MRGGDCAGTADDLQRVLDQIEGNLDVGVAQCQSCQEVNLFPGRTNVREFVCRYCGVSNSV